MKQVVMRSSLPIAAGCLLALALLFWLGRGWHARSHEPQRLRQAAERLLLAFEESDRGKFRAGVSRAYRDGLGHDRENACARLMELRAEFGTFALDPALADPQVAGATGEIELTIRDFRFDGGPLAAPLAGEIRNVGLLGRPLRTRWRREGFWPGRWRLVELLLPPEFSLPADYRPELPLRRQLGAGMMP